MHVYSGKIYLNGKEITAEPIRKRAEAGIAYIPEDRQNFGLVMDFSLADNLGLRGYYREPYAKKAC